MGKSTYHTHCFLLPRAERWWCSHGLCESMSDIGKMVKNWVGKPQCPVGEGEKQWSSILDTVSSWQSQLSFSGISLPRGVAGLPTQFSKATGENCFGAFTHLHPLPSLIEDLLFSQPFSRPLFPLQWPPSFLAFVISCLDYTWWSELSFQDKDLIM